MASLTCSNLLSRGRCRRVAALHPRQVLRARRCACPRAPPRRPTPGGIRGERERVGGFSSFVTHSCLDLHAAWDWFEVCGFTQGRQNKKGIKIINISVRANSRNIPTATRNLPFAGLRRPYRGDQVRRQMKSVPNLT